MRARLPPRRAPRASSASSITRCCIRRSRRCRIIGRRCGSRRCCSCAGFDLTVLQPTAYMQNILGAVGRRRSRWRVSACPIRSATRLSLVDLDDVARGGGGRADADGSCGAPPTSLSARRRSVRPKSRLRSAQRSAAASAPRTSRLRRGKRAPGPAAWASMSGPRSPAMFRTTPQEHGLIGNPNTLRWSLGRAPTDLASFFERERLQSES